MNARTPTINVEAAIQHSTIAKVYGKSVSSYPDLPERYNSLYGVRKKVAAYAADTQRPTIIDKYVTATVNPVVDIIQKKQSIFIQPIYRIDSDYFSNYSLMTKLLGLKF